MTVTRALQTFPTRNFPYGRCRHGAALPPDVAAVAPDVLHRRVLGLDDVPRPMSGNELDGLGDPFGTLLRNGAPFPLSLRTVLSALDGLGGSAALPDQLVFLVADGGHVPWSPETDELARAFRLVVARGSGSFPLLISSSTSPDSTADEAFLQIIGWDQGNEVFHYYERLLGTWFWAGMSPHALAPETRGKGPFDSHVNGSLVMKELRAPWIHWHAPLAGINAEAFSPDDPLRADPLFLARVTAERLETEIVKPGIRAWNAARVRKSVDAAGVWADIPVFARQILTSTTVNLTTSDTSGNLADPGTIIRPPLSFFLNRDVLFDTLDLAPDNPTVASIEIPGEHYARCLERYDVHRSDGAMRIEGDVHFAFLTPEPAFEDTQLIDVLVDQGRISARLVACLTMVDFTNPVFSERRAALLAFAPAQLEGPDHAGALDRAFVDAIAARAAEQPDPGSVEHEFMRNWNDAAWQDTFRARIQAYLVAARALAASADAVDEWFRLAEYRRRLFRRRPLAEFGLTTPQTNIPPDSPGLCMVETGRCGPLS